MERIVTEEIVKYREALRFIWNNCIWANPEQRHWDAVDDFKELEAVLFDVLVCRPLELQFTGIFGTNFRLMPMNRVSDVFHSLRVDIHAASSDTIGAYHFELVTGPFRKDELTLSVLGFYDWLTDGYRDFRYYKVRIDSFDSHPTFVGRVALIEVFHMDVICQLPDHLHNNQEPRPTPGSLA